MEVFKKTNIQSEIAIILSCIAFVIAVANLFIKAEMLRTIVWVIITATFVLDDLIVLDILKKEQKKVELLEYENESLKWSYRQMGRYIDGMEIEELADIDIRIENELKDIEIRKDYLK